MGFRGNEMAYDDATFGKGNQPGHEGKSLAKVGAYGIGKTAYNAGKAEAKKKDMAVNNNPGLLSGLSNKQGNFGRGGFTKSGF